MAAAGIDIKKLASLVAAVALIEVTAAMVGTRLFVPSLITTAATRTCQMLAIIFLLMAADGDLSAIGIRLEIVKHGLYRGLLWSIGCGLAAGLVGTLLYIAGKDPTAMIGGRVPAQTSQVIWLLAVGGLIGPIAEEMFFRGVLYGFFRRWGVPAALLNSTAIFVSLHWLVGPVQGYAIVQAIGGVLFAVSYELEKNLVVPITIHCLGNIAIFSLPLLF